VLQFISGVYFVFTRCPLAAERRRAVPAEVDRQGTLVFMPSNWCR